jgi:hypothetical protein
VGNVADFEQSRVGQASLFLQSVDFFDQDLWINDHTIPDDTHFVGMQHTGGNEANDRFLAVHDQGVTGVIPTLKPHNNVSFTG